MLTFLMQEDTNQTPVDLDSGVCGNYCYLQFADSAKPVVFGGKYTHPNNPCVEYTCTVSILKCAGGPGISGFFFFGVCTCTLCTFKLFYKNCYTLLVIII